MVLLLLLLMLLVSLPISGKLRMKCPPNLEHPKERKPWSFYKPGDHLVGIILSAAALLRTTLSFNTVPYSQFRYGNSHFYIASYIFAFQLVSKNRQLLHNLTLAYNIHDNYYNILGTADALLDMLSTGEANVPNYSCGRKDNIMVLINAADRDISSQMSTLANIYKIPQISIEAASEALSDKSQFPFFYRMVPKEDFHYAGIVRLLLHFRWTLIGLFSTNTGNGENFLRTFTPVLVRNGICVVISQQFSTTSHKAVLRGALSKWRQVNVFLHFTEYISINDRLHSFHSTLENLPGPIEGKVWILTGVGLYDMEEDKILKHVHSIWSFPLQLKKRPTDNAFEPNFRLKVDFQYNFRCSFSKLNFSAKGRRRCTQKAPLGTQERYRTTLITNDECNYNLIKTLFQALSAAYSSQSRKKRKSEEKLEPWQVWDPDKDPSTSFL